MLEDMNFFILKYQIIRKLDQQTNELTIKPSLIDKLSKMNATLNLIKLP